MTYWGDEMDSRWNEPDGVDLADSRDDWYVIIGSYACGPLSQDEAIAQFRGSAEAGHKPRLARIMADCDTGDRLTVIRTKEEK